MYYKLRTINTINELLKFDELTRIFKENKELSISCQLELAKLNNNNSYYLEELINDKQLDKPKHLWFIRSLTIIAIVSSILAFIYPLFGLLLIPVLAINMVYHYKNKHSVTYYLNGVNQLSRALKVSKKLSSNAKIASHFKDLTFINRIQKIKFKTEFIAFEKNVSNEFLFAFWFLFEMIKIMFNVEYLMFYSFLNAISKERKSIEDLFLFIGKIDVAISTASLKSGNLKICTPTFNELNTLEVQKIYHPLIEQCIANDVTLSNKSILLTGSNMSGKSTFLRSLGINMVLSGIGSVVCASEANVQPLPILVSMRLSDSLSDSESYFFAEIKRLKLIMDALEDKPAFVLLDEILRGTNSDDKRNGTIEVVKKVIAKNAIGAIATHDIEVCLTTHEYPNTLTNKCFEVEIVNNDLHFDYKLRDGICKNKSATFLMKKIGVI